MALLGSADHREKSPLIGVERKTFSHCEYFAFWPTADIRQPFGNVR
jgi:hypothetical protein